MTRPRRRALLAFMLAAAVVAATTQVRTDDPVSSNVRFTGEIVRIFDRKCASCHGANSLSMPLTSYHDVRAWGRAIREEIVEQRMPPWSVARGYGRFRNDLSLSAREMMTVLSWVDGGMPRGDDRDLPTPPRPEATVAPDVRVVLPPQAIPPLEDHVVRRVTVPITAADRPIVRVSLTPGAVQTLRGALIFTTDEDDAGRWIGAWLPWQHDAAPPPSHGFRLPHDARLTVELHYRGAEREVTDRSSIAVYYSNDASQTIDEISLGTSPERLSTNATVWAIVPSAGNATQSLELTARRPDGAVEVLLWMPRPHREWPQALVLDRPAALPAGTTVSLVATPADGTARARLSLLK